MERLAGAEFNDSMTETDEGETSVSERTNYKQITLVLVAALTDLFATVLDGRSAYLTDAAPI